MAELWVYLVGIAAGVFLAFYGLSSRKWSAFFAGAAIALVSTYTSGVI